MKVAICGKKWIWRTGKIPWPTSLNVKLDAQLHLTSETVAPKN